MVCLLHGVEVSGSCRYCDDMVAAGEPMPTFSPDQIAEMRRRYNEKRRIAAYMASPQAQTHCIHGIPRRRGECTAPECRYYDQ